MIKNGDIIRIGYTGKLDDGTVFDTTSEEVAQEHGIHDERVTYGSPLIMLGSKQVLPGLEEDIVGKEAGYEGEVEIPTEKAFGESNPELVKTYSITKFDERPYPGQQVTMDGGQGMVETVIGRRARVNFNHPLAGRTVIYEYSLEEVVEGDAEKVKAILEMYIGADLKVKITKKKVTVSIPQEMAFNQRLMFSKKIVADKILEQLDVDEVVFMEKYTREPEVTPEEVTEEATEESTEETSTEEATEESTEDISTEEAADAPSDETADEPTEEESKE